MFHQAQFNGMKLIYVENVNGGLGRKSHKLMKFDELFMPKLTDHPIKSP